MRIKVLFFGMLKDIVRVQEETLELEDGQNLESVFDHYARAFPRLRQMRSSILVARNQEFSAASTTVSDGDEVAFLPPVSGGSGLYTHEISGEDGHFFALTRHPIKSAGLSNRLLRPLDGAVVNFEGVVRNNSRGRKTKFLDYECYEAMAVKMMAEIGRAIAGSHAIGRIGMVHRLGRLQIGEVSVAVVVTAPHRKPAFEAALEGINRLKRSVPIWKKEHFADGEIWVDGEWDDSIVRSVVEK